ncbi:signal transduction histidine kinase [Paraburkholderia sp. GAS199]|uniref:PAS domain-containing sensor histidine kinase n=1 Tax=Paraburkholderia sp. GAS199 TaxID=3035126 RepID=UPI003D210F8B
MQKRLTETAELFLRLAEPHLILDERFEPILANAAWHACFGGAGAQSPAMPAAVTELAGPHLSLIDSVAGNLRHGKTWRSPVVRLDCATHESPRENAHCWQVVASHISGTDTAAPLVCLRYEDATGRPAIEEVEGRKRACNHARGRLHQQLLAQRAAGNSQFERALDLAGLGAWEIDLHTEEVRCNDQCLRDLGVRAASDIELTHLLIGPEQKGATFPWMESDSCPYERELQVVGAVGTRWILIKGLGYPDQGNALRSVAGITLDITSRKVHELELDALVQNERSARQRSEALARTVDQFVAAVSHELRSPLNAIISWGELLQLATEPTHIARAGEAIRRNGRQLAHMVDDLLDSGALATGKLSMNRQPVDLGALAALVAEDVRKTAQGKGLHLVSSSIAPCRIMGDESRLKQVVWNLLANAIKFTDAGVVELLVTVLEDRAILSVRDTGRGIEPEALPLLFDRFQQIAPQSSGRVGGLGLGLWLAKHIVAGHEGTITAKSEGAGCGATFTVSLPLL